MRSWVIPAFTALLCFIFLAVTLAQEKEVDWRKLETNLAKAVNARDHDAIKTALMPILVQGTSKGAKIVLSVAEKIPQSEDTIYWQLVNAIAAFTDSDALGFIAEVLVKANNALSRDVMFAMQSNRCDGVIKFFGTIVRQGAPDLRKMAIEQLINIDKVQCVDELVEALKVLKSADAKAQVVSALRSMTGADCGDAAEDWAKWWDVSRSQGLRAGEKNESEKSAGGYGGTCIGELDKARRDKLFGGENARKLKVLVITDIWEPAPPARGAGGAICFDHIEHVCEKLGIETVVIKRKEFQRPEYKIPDDVDGVAINCVQWHEHCICPHCSPGAGKRDRLYPWICSKNPPEHVPCSHKFSDDAVRKLKEYVEKGGYLFTEDWGLVDVLERAWPTLVKSGNYLPEGDVDVAPARGNTTHPFLRGVFVEQHKILKEEDAEKVKEKKEQGGPVTTSEDDPTKKIEQLIKKPDHKWKVDDESPYIVVMNKNDVTVLMVSKEIADKTSGNGTVAFTFGGPRGLGGGEAAGAAGRGRTTPTGGEDASTGRSAPLGIKGCVLHILSHFGRQKQQVDEFATQNLLLNFLIESRMRRSGK